MKFFYQTLLLFFILINNLSANTIVIKNPLWKTEWSNALMEEFTKNSYAFLENPIVEEDLDTLFCPNYFKLSNDEKSIFWVYFFSGLTKAESSFNEKVRSRAPKGGHGNYGLLQLSKRTARTFCELNNEDVYDGVKNLKCGVRLMDYQLKGAPNQKGKITKTRTLNRIFTSPIFFWGPLRKKDYRGKKILTTWMKNHISQIPNCHK